MQPLPPKPVISIKKQVGQTQTFGDKVKVQIATNAKYISSDLDL